MAAQHAEPEGFEPEPQLIRPEDFLPADTVPYDAKRLGFDRYAGGGDGAWIALAASLDSRKPSHRLFAYVMLTLFIGSFVLTLWNEFT